MASMEEDYNRDQAVKRNVREVIDSIADLLSVEGAEARLGQNLTRDLENAQAALGAVSEQVVRAWN